MTNADRVTPPQQDAMLAAMKAAGVRLIRAGITANAAGVDFARRVYAQGIQIDWIVGFGDAYQADAPTRPYQP